MYGVHESKDLSPETSGGETRGGRNVTEVHIYVHKPPEKDVPALKDLEDVLKGLDYVSEARVDPAGSVVAVWFEGGRDEREGIERAIEETGYEVSRFSLRTTFPTE
jgi:copper chaperone CopZ